MLKYIMKTGWAIGSDPLFFEQDHLLFSKAFVSLYILNEDIGYFRSYLFCLLLK